MSNNELHSDVSSVKISALCLWKVVKCHGCDSPYAVLQPLTSCSATLTFLHREPDSDDGCSGIQQLQSLSYPSDMDNNSDKNNTSEFVSSVLCRMPVLSCIPGLYQLICIVLQTVVL